MDNKMKAILKTILIYLISLIGIFYIELSVFLKVGEFGVNVPVFVYYLVYGLTAILLIVLFVVLLHNYKKEHLFLWFLKDHFVGILSFYVLLSIFINSIHKDLCLDRGLAADLIGIEWAIFAISIGVFAVWRGLVFEKVYSDKDLDDLKKEEEAIQSEKERFIFLSEKRELRRKYISSFSPVVFIGINTIALCIATGSCLMLKDYLVASENIAFFAGFCCTNTLILVLEDVVLDLWMKRQEFINKTKVSPAEINESYDNYALYSFLGLLDELDKDGKLRSFRSGHPDLDKAMDRCAQLLDEYKKDPSSASANKNELLSLFKYLVYTFKKMDRKTARKAKKITKLENKIKKIKGE